MSRGRQRPGRAAARALGAAALLAGSGAALAGLVRDRRGGGRDMGPAPPHPGVRGLHAASALLAASVLADSALEHDRGSFRNPGMFTPLVASAAVLAIGARQAANAEPRPAGAVVFGTALAVGAAGLGFHLFNVVKRPGGLSWQTLFYAAPLGAPAALALAGGLGLLGRAATAGQRRIAGVPLGRAVAAVTAAGLVGTSGEAALFHFRGAFQNPFMWLPVSLPLGAAGLAAGAALEPVAPPQRLAVRAWLWLTAGLGVAGVGFHIFGVSRAMGGWRNWRQNLIDGPPIPAPPAFSALAIAGLAALALRDAEDRR